MLTVKHFAAVLGFAFVGVWIALGFGWAVGCLAGALVFYAAASFFQGDLEREVGQIQTRFGLGQVGAEPTYAARPGTTPPPPPAPSVAPRPAASAAPRVR